MPAQREARAKLAAAVQNYEVLIARTKQDPSNYDAWLVCGYQALDIAIVLSGSKDHQHHYLEEVCNATCRHRSAPSFTLLQALSAFQNAIKLDGTRPEAYVQCDPRNRNRHRIVLRS